MRLIDVSADYQADMLAQRQRYIDHHRSEIDSMMATGKSLDEALAALPIGEYSVHTALSRTCYECLRLTAAA